VPNPKLPVVLVHGYLATQGLMGPMKWRLGRAGFDVHTLDLPPLNLADVRVGAERMRDNLEVLLRRLESERCDLVGVSLGGLMTLRYVKQMGGAPRVRRMIALGTPFQGSWAALPAVALLGGISKAAWQSLPGSTFLEDLAQGPLPEGVQCFSIFARHDPVSPPARCRLEGAANLEVTTVPPPLTHQGLIFAPAVYRELERILGAPDASASR